jgi:hypothetical protein
MGVDGSGNVYFATATLSTDYPVTSDAIQSSYGGGDADSAITRINAAGTAIDWSTYFGGSSYEIIQNLAVDSSGNVYVTGWTDNTSLMGTSSSSIQSTYGGADGDAFVAKIASTGSPSLTSISPSSGPVGTQVTFTGTGFGAVQGSGSVWLANNYATIVSWSDTQVVATVVTGSTTSASHVNQGGVGSNTITFTVTP